MLVARLGEKTYRGAFSVASIAALWWLIREYGRAPYRPLWVTPEALSYLPVLVMPLSLVLLAGAFLAPAAPAGAGDLPRQHVARGVQRVTRHPFLWSVVLWASVHLLVRPDVGSVLFFGSLGLTALRGSFDIDRKRRRAEPEAFARWEAVTSNVPLGALLARRNRLVASEVGGPVMLGLVLTLAAIGLHPSLFGSAALPGR